MSHEERETTRNPICAGVRALGAFVLPALILTGCPGEGGPGTEQADTTAMDTVQAADTMTADTIAAGTAVGDEVQVSLTDFSIEMPETLPAGPTTFRVSNDGAVEHNFEVEGQGMEEELEENLAPGGTGTLQVDLEPGTYEIYCPVADHADRGMRMELTVQAGGGGGR